uniref:Eukaryotic initiation factor n=1 Tax=Ulva partita TaxID=1605170 RepID=A0A1C9ZWB6_9CHLO|nr:eukaryotic initiation factor [Ulva partita]
MSFLSLTELVRSHRVHSRKARWLSAGLRMDCRSHIDKGLARVLLSEPYAQKFRISSYPSAPRPCRGLRRPVRRQCGYPSKGLLRAKTRFADSRHSVTIQADARS